MKSLGKNRQETRLWLSPTNHYLQKGLRLESENKATMQLCKPQAATCWNEWLGTTFINDASFFLKVKRCLHLSSSNERNFQKEAKKVNSLLQIVTDSHYQELKITS